MDNYQRNRDTILRANDGNFMNSDEPEFSGYSRTEEVKCGYCGDVQEDAEAKACKECLKDDFIKNYIGGK